MSAINGKTWVAIGSEFRKILVDLIDETKESLDVFMFDWRWYFNDFSCDVSLINQAIVRAVRRGVRVRAVCNYGELLPQFEELGIQAKRLRGDRLMHAKCFIFDKKSATLGSHNLTSNAMVKNIEISNIINDKPSVDRLSEYFETLWS